jgi:hypothetical protein
MIYNIHIYIRYMIYIHIKKNIYIYIYIIYDKQNDSKLSKIMNKNLSLTVNAIF